ncbi:MAG: DUF2284 domain-containing protein [Desulfobacterales bacterium]|nr:DUF2284 domain-containing protein [Desulfobacterales bacterium]
MQMRSGKVVPFRNNTGISHALTQRLLDKGKEYGLNAIFPFDIEQIEVAEWVHLKCQYGCDQYNTNWCCPPATPDSEKVRTILAEYSLGLLLVGSKSCTDFYMNNAKKRAAQVRCWKGTVSLERLLFLDGYFKAFSLVGECCALCKECAYPETCRFPREKRPSIESFSIDVIGTLKNLGTSSKVATQTNETFSYYGIILLE